MPTTRFLRMLLPFLLICCFLFAFPSHAAGTLTVNSSIDNSDLLVLAANATCDLREAIQAANTDSLVGQCDGSSGANTIQFDLTYPATITLAQVLPVINQDLTLDGPGASLLFLDGADAFRPLSIQAGVQVKIDDLTFINGYAPTTGADQRRGGAIYNLGNLTLEQVSIFDSNGINYGGAIYNEGNLELKTVTIAGCQVGTYGGALYNGATGVMEIDQHSQIGLLNQPNKASVQGGAIYNEGQADISGALTYNQTNSLGGAIHNYNGTITLNEALLYKNSASQGGGIYLHSGDITIENTRIISNTTTNAGAAIDMPGGDLQIERSVIAGNRGSYGSGLKMQGGTTTIRSSLIKDNISEGGSGGGITLIVGGSLVLEDSTLTGNLALDSDGGGMSILAGTTATVRNSTFSGNQATGYGGGIFVRGTLNISHSTISQNTTDSDSSGGGEGGGLSRYEGYVNLHHNLIANNIDPGGEWPDCYNRSGSANFSSSGYNLVNQGSCFDAQSGDQFGVSAGLDGLANNGGPTLPGGYALLTHALKGGSPAINAGNPSFTPPPEYDQRGFGYPRVVNVVVDIGAFEARFGAFLPLVQR